MRALVLVALAACGASPPSHAVSSTAAPSSAGEPLLLFKLRHGQDSRQLRWVSGNGARGGVPTGLVLDETWEIEPRFVGSDATWLLVGVNRGNDSATWLGRATRSRDGVALDAIEKTITAAVSSDGRLAAMSCSPRSEPNAVCVTQIAGAALGTERRVDGTSDEDVVMAMRGGSVLVSPLSQNLKSLAILDPTTGTRTPVPLPALDVIIDLDPTGAAAATYEFVSGAMTITAFDDPAQGFVVPATGVRSPTQCKLVTASTLVCVEPHSDDTGDGALLVAVTKTTRTVISTALDNEANFAATPERIAFVDTRTHRIVSTDLRGDHRRELFEIPPGSDVTPLAWLR